MKKNRSINIPLDQFIELALYDRNIGYYMKKNPFGKKGDFVTSPNITSVFSEIITIWVITFWKSINSPKKFNLLELGAGNGKMMKVIIDTLKRFPECFEACNFIIHEKSSLLINQQKSSLNFHKVSWIKDIEKINSNPTIFLANEFFDAMPVKQYFKKKNDWFERFVNLKDLKIAEFNEKKVDIREIEKDIKIELSKNQTIIEYSPKAFQYLKTVCQKIQTNNGGLLIIDYGYIGTKMQETLQALNNHKHSNILENIGDSDITYNINFNLFKKFVSQFRHLNSITTNQKKFLTSMGIIERSEIISKKIPFSKKADLFLRIKRLIDEKQMGELFKVMLIKNINNKFKTGF